MINELFIILDLKNNNNKKKPEMSLSSMEQKIQTAIVKQKMSNLDEEGKLRQVL